MSNRAKIKERYPGFRQEARAAAAKARDFGEAAAEPLPGPLLDAFGALPAVIGGLTVRPVVHYDFVVLRMIESPLLEVIKGDKKRAPWADEQGYEMIWIFTRPAAQVRDFVEEHKGDMGKFRAAFRTQAVDEIGLKVGPLEMPLLVQAVCKAMAAAFSSVLEYSTPREPGATETFPTATPGTASGGGSITSAG